MSNTVIRVYQVSSVSSVTESTMTDVKHDDSSLLTVLMDPCSRLLRDRSLLLCKMVDHKVRKSGNESSSG